MSVESANSAEYEQVIQVLRQEHFTPPNADTKVYKDECIYCFNTPFFEGGLYVCLKTYCSFCPRHVAEYAAENNCRAFIQHLSKKVEEVAENPAEPEQKISRLAVGIDGGFNNEKFEIVDDYCLVIYPNTNVRVPIDKNLGPELQAICAKVIEMPSAERLEMLRNATNAWDGEMKQETKHANMKPLDNGKIVPYSGWVCEEAGCGLTENLWLNLTDGAIRCGRSQFISEGQKSKGNNHMKQYYDATGFPLVVKLGTIENEAADVYSYDEDDAVIDPNLKLHLAHFGLDVDRLHKTEKSTLELELDMNQKWEWSKIQEDGANLENAYGPGMTGLINIGSSCYMNSVLQSFLLVPDFCNRFGGANALHTMHALPPADMYMDFNGQLARLVHAMLEGDYALPGSPHNGIKPTQFKRIAGAGHPEFKTARQQDAEEYVRYLIEKITAKTPAGVPDPMLAFKFHKEERLQDLNTRKVRYTQNEETVLAVPVLKSSLHAIPDQEGRFSACFEECLANVFEPEQIEDRYLKRVTFKSFPDFLIVQLQKFTVDEVTYQQKKLDIDLAVPDVLDLSQYRSLGGLQPDETPMEENEPIVVAAPKLDVDENIVTQLEGMGFSRNAALKAALDTKTQGLEAAAEWIMVRLDDPSLNDPPVNPAGPVKVNPGTSVDNESVSMLEGFGFTKHQARFALNKFNFDANMAAEWLFVHIDEVPPEPAAEEKPVVQETPVPGVNQMRDGNGKYRLVGFISHMGSSPHSGHYVAHLLRGDRWVLYNDEKVAYSQNPPKQLAYLYLYRRH